MTSTDSVATTQVPSNEELLARAAELAQLFRERAVDTERERRLLPEVVDAYVSSGLVRCRVPRRWGGYEVDAETVFDIATTIAHGDASSAWVCTYWTQHAYLVALFPEAAQAAVWGDGPDALVATSFVPKGQARREGDGYVLNGRWPWCSGIDGSSWVMVGGLVFPDEPGPPHMRVFLVPKSQGTVVDTWHNAGLAGTGSNDFVLEDVYVDADLSCDFAEIREGTAPGGQLNDNPAYRVPLVASEMYVFVSTSLGAVRGAIDAWAEMAKTKVGAYTQEQVSESGPAQVRFAALVSEVDAAELLARRSVKEAEHLEAVDLALRVRARRDGAYAMRMLVGAAEDLLRMGGASSLFEANPVQRAWRDVHAISTHVGVNFDDAGRNYARFALGQPLSENDPVLLIG